jgi:hypothetical protein
MTLHATARRAAAVSIAALLGLGFVACEDEDGDGAETDEEVDQLDEQGEDTRDQVEEEVDEGEDEVDN